MPAPKLLSWPLARLLSGERGLSMRSVLHPSRLSHRLAVTRPLVRP